MAQNKLRLRVITPSRVVFDEAVRFVVVRSTDGELGIFPSHEAAVIELDFGDLRIFSQRETEQTSVLAVMGGFAFVEPEQVTILSELAEHPDKVDRARLDEIHERAESRRREKASDAGLQRAEAAIRRSLVRGDAGVSAILEQYADTSNQEDTQ